MKILIPIISFLTFCSISFAQNTGIEKGLRFRSYEVAPNLRTSLRIPAEENGNLKYDGFLALSFDIKIDTHKECFGYVCRILLEDNDYADILLTNPTDGEAHLVLASKHGELMNIRIPSSSSLKEWNRIEILLSSKDNATDITINGISHHLTCSQDRIHTAAIYFGANSQGIFSTSDVAPMSLRNLSLKTNEKSDKTYFWELSTEDDLNRGSGKKRMSISVENPEWIIESNCSWQLASSLTFAGKVKTVVDDKMKRIYLISQDRVTTLVPQTGQSIIHPFSQDICFRKLTNDFNVLPDGRLIYFDPEGQTPVISEFDFNSGKWSPDITRKINSSRLHHNSFYNPLDSCVVHMFGYGFHRYSNDICIWSETQGSFRRWTLDSIPPRYLSAVGVSDSLAWIYGGKGNAKGIQELGTIIYNDLYSISLEDYEVHKAGTVESANLEVAATDLIVSEDRKSLTALFYSPNTYQSSLQMKKINIDDCTISPLGNSIPYSFLDVDSEARLIYDSDTHIYYAVITQKSDDGSYRVNVYKILAPVICTTASSGTTETDVRWRHILYPVLALAVILSTAVFFIRRRKLHKSEENAYADSPRNPQAPGIYLIGGFKVINMEGIDISGRFTPLTKQLLCILVLYSYRQKGISNVELKETLWNDKSEESYYNNRGVNIKKLRTCISEVGNIEIQSANGNWSVNADEHICDWCHNMKILEDMGNDNFTYDQINCIIDTAMNGTLLPDMRYEWADKFKAQYTDLMISKLEKIKKSLGDSISDTMQIRISDAVLTFDSLDEDSVKAKCKALINQKRLGIAQSIFKNFTQEYNRLMGEEYSISFNEFVK